MSAVADLLGARSLGLIAASTGATLATPIEVIEADQPPTRWDPLPGDLVRWHDGTFGTVADPADWLDDGETLVYRHRDQAQRGGAVWLTEARSLTAASQTADGRVTFTYTGSLG